ncbi:amidase [Bifidobacterium sp. DSM 109958]|uniref:Amidase n=1 Tax=Bifidobacterium moraviense TaxID=2675323 RepID=A0A7Y0F130_9BIFI|nr:CHAP domain-containing protein [Bifidobacterium sp. DSM 109958]NMN00078.1 amidase [Bifidobacterium sp. DSM 109958]
MRHAAHKAPRVARAERAGMPAGKSESLFAPAVDAALAARLNEVAPQSRRAMREAAKASARRNHVMAGTALAALFGTAAGAVALAGPAQRAVSVADPQPQATSSQVFTPAVTDGEASRSQVRKALAEAGIATSDVIDASNVDGDQPQDSVAADGSAQDSGTNGSWSLGEESTDLDVSQMSKSKADNATVAALMDVNAADIPAGFNPNHDTQDYGSTYSFSQCTWWVYLRRHELNLPVGSHYGNGYMWADSARSLGYWVDDTPRNVGDIMVFRQGQEGSSSAYGHVAIVEAINPDGSVTTSECGASYNGRTFSRTFTNVHDFQYIHY